MKTASLQEIKQELHALPAEEVTALCLRLARFKKDNKELLAFLLFDAHNVEAFTEDVKADMDEAFETLNTSNIYLAKKTLRKVLKMANKYIKYTANKQTEAQLLLHFCTKLKASGIVISRNKALHNMYFQQIKKMKAALATLHPDIQYDFIKDIQKLQE